MRRRNFIATGAHAALAAFAAPAIARTTPAFDAHIKPSGLPEEFNPREIGIDDDMPPNEIHVYPGPFALHLTLPGNRAIRYSVGIGRPDLYESGEFFVGDRRVWPSWRPTDSMIKRDPGSYAKHAGGMPGGPGNPLGARALYLYQRGRGDTFLRIHGTNQPETIGQSVSNGCARLINEHMVDLYDRVPLRTRVVLHPMT